MSEPSSFPCPFCGLEMISSVLIDQQSMIIFEAQEKMKDTVGRIQGHLPKVFLNKKRVCGNCGFIALFGR